MAKEIVTASKLPLATAKEKDGIVLYWVEELGIAGIHQNGLAKLLRCETGTIQQAIKTIKEFAFWDAEIITTSGLKTIKLISETDLAKLLRHIARSKAKTETRDRADDIRDRLAAAGFKLMVMLELAPAELAARAVSHFDEIEALKLKREIATQEAIAKVAEEKILSLRHYVATACPEPVQQKILGYTEVKTVEYRDRVYVNNEQINDGSTVNKTWLCKRYGFVTKSGAPDYKQLTRILESIALEDSCWNEVIVSRSDRQLKREAVEILDRAIYTAEQRQRWIGE